MTLQIRVQYPGAIHHMLNRGDRREDILRDDADGQRFLDMVDELCGKTYWQTPALGLMPNNWLRVVLATW